MIKVSDLWWCLDPKAWNEALKRYWDFVQPKNLVLERSLDKLDLERLRAMDALGWYDFLKDEYFRWKFTAPNRYATTTRQLRRYLDQNSLRDLDQIRRRLLALDPSDIRAALETAYLIMGLGAAGASGLLALMYPQHFGTVDQFLVKALRQVRGLPEAPTIAQMKSQGLNLRDGVFLIDLLRRKAAENNRLFKSNTWTPRKLDKVLWTYGR
jgi:hypothetical protein